MKPTLEQIKQLYPPGTVFIPAHLQNQLLDPSTRRKISEYTMKVVNYDNYGEQYFELKGDSYTGMKSYSAKLMDVNGDKSLARIVIDPSLEWLTKENTRLPSLSDLTSAIANKVIQIPAGIDAVAIRCIKECRHYHVGDITWVSTNYVGSDLKLNECVHPESNIYGINYHDSFELVEKPVQKAVESKLLGKIEFLKDHPIILEKLKELSSRKSLDGYAISSSCGGNGGGFNWASSKEGHGFWEKVLSQKNPDHYYTKYPKTPLTVFTEWQIEINATNLPYINQYRKEQIRTSSFRALQVGDYKVLITDETGDDYRGNRANISLDKLKSLIKTLPKVDSTPALDPVSGLPVKWVLKLTEENLSLVNEFRVSKSYDRFHSTGAWKYIRQSGEGTDEIQNYIEITDQQFKDFFKPVAKPFFDIMTNPWFVKVTTENLNAVNILRKEIGDNKAIDLNHEYKYVSNEGLGYRETEINTYSKPTISSQDLIRFLATKGFKATLGANVFPVEEVKSSIPEKWHVLITRENMDLCQKFRDTTIFGGKYYSKIQSKDIGLKFKDNGERSAYPSTTSVLLSSSEFESLMRERGIIVNDPLANMHNKISIHNKHYDLIDASLKALSGFDSDYQLGTDPYKSEKQLKTIQVGMIPVK